MKGNTLSEFINDLLTMGGPEKEYEYRGKRYFMESQPYELDPTQVEFVIFECFGDENYIFKCHGKIKLGFGEVIDLRFDVTGIHQIAVIDRVVVVIVHHKTR